MKFPRSVPIPLTTVVIALLLVGSPTGGMMRREAQQPAPAPRRNIGLFFDKLRAGKAVTVAYLGGSITAGVGAGDPARSSWRALVTNWLREHFPQATINEINAAAGNTGSDYGAMRVRRDVIAHKPDLVLLEFAVNDWHLTEQTAKESLEGIIRQLLLQPQPPEIVLVYTTRANGNTRAAWHEEIAEYYHLPSLNPGALTFNLLEKEEVSPEAFWKDGVHPIDVGHKFYAQVITKFLAEEQRKEPSSLPRTLPAFLEPDALTYGEIKPFAEFSLPAAWKMETVSDPLLPARLLRSEKIGAEFETTFEGTAIGIAYRTGPDCGIIELLIDGKPAPAPLRRIDCYQSAPQLQTRIITSGLDSSLHKLTIRVMADKNQKSSGHFIRLASLLVGGQRPERL